MAKPHATRKSGKPHATRKSRKPHAKCGARLKRRDGTCTKAAGWRTDHPGQGKCYLHGGATPIRNGRYSSIQNEELGEKIAKFAEDPDPLNLEPEVAVLRALLEELLDRWYSIYGPDGALLAWHESFTTGTEDKEKKPRELPDISSVSAIVDRVGKMVERIHKFRAEQTISLATLNRVCEQMGVELVAAVREVKLEEPQSSQLLKAVERRWGSLRLEPGRSGG